MSMHEFEDLVEASIRTLANHPRHSRADRRSFFAQLYAFQDCWDTGFTEMRVIDLLLAAGYSYRFPVQAHPDYGRFQTYFDSLRDFTFIPGHPGKPYDKLDNPIACFYAPPYCYFDVGSPLWRRLVEDGTLQGTDAVLPRQVDLAKVAAEVVEDAREDGDIDLISRWYLLLIWHLYASYGDQALAHVSSTTLTHIRQVAFDTGATNVMHTYGYLAQRPGEFLSQSPLLAWWFDYDTPLPR